MTQKINILELRVVKGSGGGPEKTILLSAERIDKEKFSTVIVYIGEKGDKSFGVTQKAMGREIEYIELWERWKFDWRILIELYRIIKRYHIHIIHAHDYKSDILAWLIGFVAKVRLFSTVHGWIENTTKERFYNLCDRIVLRWYDKIIAVNKLIMARLIQSGINKRKIELIHNAIDIDDYERVPFGGDIRDELGIKPNTPVIGYVGRLSAEKDLPILFMAVKILSNEFPQLRAVIAGDGPLKECLKEYCKKIGVESNVIFLGQRMDIKRIYQTIDVFVLTSKTEGIPNVILEAMAMQVPVVSTNVGGVGEIITHNVDGFLVEPGDVNSLCNYLRKLLTDKETKNRLIKEAYKTVSNKFSFANRLKRIEGLYTNCLS